LHVTASRTVVSLVGVASIVNAGIVALWYIAVTPRVASGGAVSNATCLTRDCKNSCLGQFTNLCEGGFSGTWPCCQDGATSIAACVPSGPASTCSIESGGSTNTCSKCIDYPNGSDCPDGNWPTNGDKTCYANVCLAPG
jgi:hypothetical protein